jgi:hypothetical protein
MPATPGQVPGQGRGVLGVIKDQQPPVPLPQYPQQPGHRHRRGVGDARQTQGVGQLGQPVGHGRI